MAKQTVNIGTTAGDGTGDPLRTAFNKLNSNFDEIYGDKLDVTGNGSSLTGLTKAQVGLTNADNTSDLNKPISTAAQSALDLKQNLDATLTALSALDTSAGILEQTGADTFTKRLVGATNATDLLTRDNGDTRYSPVAHNHVIADVTNLQTNLDAKELSIAAGTTSQYWRGDKSWQTLDKSVVGLSNVDNTSDVDKPVSTVTQTALDGKTSIKSVVEVTGTAYALLLSDSGDLLKFTNAATVVVTVPTNTNVGYPIGTTIELLQSGAGQVTVVGDSGVTIQYISTKTAATIAQYGILKLIKHASDTWSLTGDLA